MTVELIKPHTHAGVLFAPGAHLNVSDATAQWLIDHAVAKPAQVPDTSDSKPQPIARKGD